MTRGRRPWRRGRLAAAGERLSAVSRRGAALILSAIVAVEIVPRMRPRATAGGMNVSLSPGRRRVVT